MLLSNRLRGAALTATALTVLVAAPALAQTELTILHVNDMDVIDHSPQLATLVAQYRADAENSLLIVAGDFLSPSLLSGLDHGANIIDTFNALGVDYVVFGNHEFDFGPENALARMGESRFVWLGTNVRDRSTGEPFGNSVASATIEVGEYTVGLVGLLTPDTYELSSPGDNVDIQDPAEALAAEVAVLEEAGVDAIVAITHLPIDDDMALVERAAGVDAFIGGHDPILLSIKNDNSFFQESGSEGRYLGVVRLLLDTVEGRNGPETQVSVASWGVVATDGVEADPDLQALVDRYEVLLDEELGVVIGTTETELVSLRSAVRTEETTVGNLIADALREGVDADIAITNGGGIRGDTTYPAGTELTRRDVLTELPFGNVTVKLSLTGEQIVDALENGVGQVEEGAGRFPQVSGLSFTYDPSKEPGSRVVEVHVGGERLDPSATYTVATNDFMAVGGDGYTAFVGAPQLIDAAGGIIMATMVMDYISARGTIAPEVEGRITRAE